MTWPWLRWTPGARPPLPKARCRSLHAGPVRGRARVKKPDGGAPRRRRRARPQPREGSSVARQRQAGRSAAQDVRLVGRPMGGYVLDHHLAGERSRLALMSRLLDPMHRRHIDSLGVGQGARVLEVGCGTARCPPGLPSASPQAARSSPSISTFRSWTGRRRGSSCDRATSSPVRSIAAALIS